MATKDVKAILDKAIADVDAHETLDGRRKAHAIQAVKELRAAFSAPDADVNAIVAGKLQEYDQRLAVITADRQAIELENVDRAKEHKRLLPIPAPDLTLAQRHYTHSILQVVADAIGKR